MHIFREKQCTFPKTKKRKVKKDEESNNEVGSTLEQGDHQNTSPRTPFSQLDAHKDIVGQRSNTKQCGPGMKSQGAISSQNLDVERDGFTKMEMKLYL